MAHDATGVSEGDVNISPLRAKWRETLDAETHSVLEEDECYFLKQSLSTPCLDAIERAEGAILTDLAGRRLLDFHGNSVHQLGHGHPAIVAAIKQQLDELSFCPRRFTNRTAIALARRLAEVAPGRLNKVLLAPSGAAAISMALKLARYATGRHKTLSMWDAFHGANLDTIAVGGEALFRHGMGPMMPGTEHLPPFDLVPRFFGPDRPFDRFADYIDYVLRIQGDVAAVLAEPMRWTTVKAPPVDFWPRVRQSCTRHGALLIFDEIPSGFARTGAMFACQHFGTTPDILVVGKGLGGGIMPMAAVIADERLDCASETSIGHYTHEKSPVGCAAALAMLDVIARDRLIERAQELNQLGLEQLEKLKSRHSAITEVRSLGCYFGIVIGEADAEAAAMAEQILYSSLTKGLSFKLGGGNVITLCPPLTIPTGQFLEAFAILDQSLAECAVASG